MPDNLWAPWRLSYVSDDDKTRDGCFLCRAAEGAAMDEETLVVARGRGCFCLLNRYPYNNGHVMVSPNRHVADLADLTADERAETMDMLAQSMAALRGCVGPHGFNVGWNVGAAAGAGVAEHLHAHVVPRWRGDTNFMAVIADVKVVPQALGELWELLRDAWPGGNDDGAAQPS